MSRITTSILLTGLVISLSGTTALAAGPGNAALITQVSGKATYRMIAGTPAIGVRPFMKARTGDLFELDAGATVRLVYYRVGHQETWTGPVKFQVGTQKSQVTDGQAAPLVTQLPQAGARALARMPAILKRSGVTRLGAARVRAAQVALAWRTEADLTEQEQAELKEARATFVLLSGGRVGEDPTPELVLLSTLTRLRLKEALQAQLPGTRKRFPLHPIFIKLERWVSPPVDAPAVK
jgi:hypothetical protein